jgi:peptide/nickel transport system permease protein
LLILVFAVCLVWFPAAGRDGLASLVLPATALGAFSMARIARMARSGMLEVLAQDYVRTARAAGVRTFVVTYKYALKNAAIPLVTIVGLEFGILLGGAVITETIFAWPGVGRLAVDAIFSRDYPLVQAIVAMLATILSCKPGDGPGLHLLHPPVARAEQAVSEAASPAAVADHRPVAAPAAPDELSRRVGISVLLLMGGAARRPQIARGIRGARCSSSGPAPRGRRGAESIRSPDLLGRGILARILYACRIRLGVGRSAGTLSCLIGVTLGLLAGFHGGRTDAFIMRVVDVFLAIPYILLAMGVVFALGPSLLNVILVMAVTRWVQFARIVRADVLSIREREFVSGARARGNRSMRLLLRHVLPNALTPIIVVATLELAFMIIYESALSFLGLGVQPPTPTWGWMLSDGRNYVATAWWLATFPGLAIMLLVLAGTLL